MITSKSLLRKGDTPVPTFNATIKLELSVENIGNMLNYYIEKERDGERVPIKTTSIRPK
jgi:hypothetical protein